MAEHCAGIEFGNGPGLGQPMMPLWPLDIISLIFINVMCRHKRAAN